MFGSISEAQLTIVGLGWQSKTAHNMLVKKSSERIPVLTTFQFLPFIPSWSLYQGMEQSHFGTETSQSYALLIFEALLNSVNQMIKILHHCLLPTQLHHKRVGFYLRFLGTGLRYQAHYNCGHHDRKCVLHIGIARTQNQLTNQKSNHCRA